MWWPGSPARLASSRVMPRKSSSTHQSKTSVCCFFRTLGLSSTSVICYAGRTKYRIALFLDLGSDVRLDTFQAEFMLAVIHAENVVFRMPFQTNVAENSCKRLLLMDKSIVGGYLVRQPCSTSVHRLLKLLQALEKVSRFSVDGGRRMLGLDAHVGAAETSLNLKRVRCR